MALKLNVRIVHRITVFIVFFVCFSVIAAGQARKSANPKASSSVAKRKKLSAEQIAARYLRRVVLIKCDDGVSKASLGSGFYVGSGGLIVTNYHVVKDMARGSISNVHGSRKAEVRRIFKIVSVDEAKDLAVLETDPADIPALPELKLTRQMPRVGETIYVLGNPLGLSGTISQGLVASELRKTKRGNLLQINAAISPGSSGGPVLDVYGDLVGVVVSSIENGQNLNFAIPQSVLEQFLRSVADNEAKSTYSLAARVANAWLQPHGLPSESLAEREPDSRPPVRNGPSLKEVTDWLSNRLHGRNEVLNGGYEWKIDRLGFFGCDMDFTSTTRSAGGSFTRSTSVFLRSIREARPGKTKDGEMAVWLFFDGNVPASETYRTLDGRESKEVQNSDNLVLFTGTNDLAVRVANAFNHVIRLCEGGKKKDPFE